MSSSWNRRTVAKSVANLTPEQANENVWGHRSGGRRHHKKDRSDRSYRSDHSHRSKNRSVSAVHFSSEDSRKNTTKEGRVQGHKDLVGHYFGLDVEGQEADFLETKKET